MSEPLPSGTVTFLFTDVEGSTRLLEELGADEYAVELGRHRQIVRDAVEAYDGVEIDTQGDAFFCAFASARSAVRCAVQVHDGLDGGAISVRIGIHTGEALVVGRHYVGMDVHRAARIGACGHGGQIVVSPSTVALLEPDEFALRDLGTHRLKDLAAPVVLHQVGEHEFPPLKALFRTNLPVPATPFLGRADELVELVACASEPGVRVLTLTGPGGTGKTRLALQLAAELSDAYPDGLWWVPLAPLRDGALVASAVAGALEVEEEPGRSLVDSLSVALVRKRVLVLLDNCEHVVEASAQVAAAVSGGSPETLVVATSREALAIRGEHVFPVRQLVEEDSVELFHARAHAAGAQLERPETDRVVAALCARLDNLPLAVELAAARAPALSPAALLDRLASRLDVLAGPRDVDERQRTLRATIGWSHDLLDESERRLFRRFAVFVGGASLSTLETVCEADLGEILSLVSKSLVRHASVESDQPRYFMLETIRDFAAEQLAAAGETERTQERHAEWFAELARVARVGIEGPESGEHILSLERDLANLRAALAWSEEAGRTSDALVLGNALLSRDFMRGHYSDAEDGLRRALALEPDPVQSMDLHTLLGAVLRLRGHPEEALRTLLEYEQTLETIPGRDAEWWASWIDAKLRRGALLYFENRGDELAALIRELEPVVAEHGTDWQRFELLELRGQHAFRRERYMLSEQTETLVREIHRHAVALDDLSADFTLGFCLLWRGKLEEAEACFATGLVTARSRGSALLETRCLVYGVIARRRKNDVEGVRAWLRELEHQDELHGYIGLTSANAAWLAWRDGDLDVAAARGHEALAEWASRSEIGSSVFQWTARFPLLGVSLKRRDPSSALEHVRAMLDPAQQPLPSELAAAVEHAAGTAREDDLAHALELAAARGYA